MLLGHRVRLIVLDGIYSTTGNFAFEIRDTAHSGDERRTDADTTPLCDGANHSVECRREADRPDAILGGFRFGRVAWPSGLAPFWSADGGAEIGRATLGHQTGNHLTR